MLQIQYCDKQQTTVGNLYGTMRRSRDASCQLRPSATANSNQAAPPPLLPPPTGGGEEQGIVVPPPPMFEEGKLNMKTPLIHKKCGKDGKKDKMESRV